ncbi:hypothetical protein ALNOE001_14950 [Candidatus Methanobinarius endosymbioticus]|uniref:Uncharacterized protein n=1 Tax=Candidatus Methanobinarius endosymbioticus TaxID=2006182 RepID=A0A366MBB4_9EURY|nr:hypothetical protein ALNOE001_14950 [Candidatus Methanobinarius endosymbioticus]
MLDEIFENLDTEKKICLYVNIDKMFSQHFEIFLKMHNVQNVHLRKTWVFIFLLKKNQFI